MDVDAWTAIVNWALKCCKVVVVPDADGCLKGSNCSVLTPDLN